MKKDDTNHTAAEKKGPLGSPYAQKVSSNGVDIEPHAEKQFSSQCELYTAVKKNLWCANE